MPFARPTAVIGLDLLHDSDLGAQAFARHVGEHLPVDRARLVVAGMRGVLEGKSDLRAEAFTAFPALDLASAFTGGEVVAALATAAGVPDDRIVTARTAAAHDLARSAWTVGPAPGLPELCRILIDHGLQPAVLAPGPIGVPEILDAIEMPGLPWVVVPAARRRDWWAEALRPVHDPETPDAPTPDPADHLVIAGHPDDLSAPEAFGVTTALVDRFGRLDHDSANGSAALGAAEDLTGLLPAITRWLERRR